MPRLVDEEFLARMQPRYPRFFERYGGFLPACSRATRSGALTDTFESFTRQRLDLRPPGLKFVSQWRAHLQRNLGGALTLADLEGKLVLDVGCGFGRHLYVACEAGAEALGVDISGGVDVARRNNLDHPRCHVVQSDLFGRAPREDCFDIVWSFGVLHHLPDPAAGFFAIVRCARAGTGLVAIWVYGCRGMAFTYRLSHMRGLRRVMGKLSDRGRVRASKMVAACLSCLYWEPLRIAKRLGLGSAVQSMPLADYVDHDWLARVAGVHDRLSTPITHFHDREELLEWFGAAGLQNIVVEDTNRRGWRAHGWRP